MTTNIRIFIQYVDFFLHYFAYDVYINHVTWYGIPFINIYIILFCVRHIKVLRLTFWVHWCPLPGDTIKSQLLHDSEEQSALPSILSPSLFCVYISILFKLMDSTFYCLLTYAQVFCYCFHRGEALISCPAALLNIQIYYFVSFRKIGSIYLSIYHLLILLPPQVT